MISISRLHPQPMTQNITPLRYEANDGTLVEHYDWGRSALGNQTASARHRLDRPDVARAPPPLPAPVELSADDRQQAGGLLSHSSFVGQDAKHGGWLFTFRLN